MDDQNTGYENQTQSLIEKKPASIPGPIALLSEAWSIFTKRAWILWGIMLSSWLAVVIFFVIALLGAFLSAMFLFAKLYFVFVALVVVLLMVFLAALLTVQFWTGAASFFAVKDYQEKIGVIESFRRSWKKLGSYFWVSIIAALVTMGGYILFIVPGIIFSVWFVFAQLISLFENERGMNAVLKSREYVRNRWWPVFLRLLFIFAFFMAISLFLEVLKSPIISNIVLFLLAPLNVVYSYLLYKYVKEVKGEFIFTPSPTKKNIYIAIAIFGVLILIVIIALIVFVVPQIIGVLDEILKAAPNALSR